MELWFSECHAPDVKHSLRVNRHLYSKKSEYQQIDIFDTPEFGRVLALDGNVMLTERDEFIYDEMITHVPMSVHKNAKDILVIGAGDGGVVKELTRYDRVERIDLVEMDGEVIDTLAGRTINPGHCIETSWFLLEEARHRSDSALEKLALQILDWSWEWGWDNEFGGIINFRDCKGFPNQDYSQDMKFWWPQTEAIIATLYAYLATGDNSYLERHRLVDEWTYSHLPDPAYGEWFGYLHRDGTVAQPAKGNLFKGPFHIPRMMVRSVMLIDDLLKQL